MAAPAIHWVLLAVAALVLLLVPGSALDDRCAACGAVAMELELALANEKPRNDIDLRHRLDSRGQRQGRIIQYKFSELRALELLEDLCSSLKDYTLDKATGAWIKASMTSSDRNEEEKQEAEVHSKDIAVYCGRLLEKHEEELASAIRSGEMAAGSVNTILCKEISRDCNTNSNPGGAGDREL